MSRLCVIGDSHSGPLQAAIRLKEFPADEVDFFVSHVDYMREIELEGSALVTGSAKLAEIFRSANSGKGQIELAAYDRVILIGLDFGMLWMANLYYHYSTDSMAPPDPGKYMVSDDVFLEVAERLYDSSEALRLARLIRSVSDVPLTLVAAPNPGEGLPAEKLKGYPPYHQIVSNGDDAALAALFRQFCERIGKANQIEVIPPMPEVAANGVFNLREYSMLPKTLDPEVKYFNEMVHADGDYCRHLARHLFRL